MTDLITSLRAARKVPHRYLMDYLNLRSRVSKSTLICVFEGAEDLPVYDVWIKRFTAERYEPLPVNGKENVLDLNVLVGKIESEADSRVLFFSDYDFDGKKGRPVDSRLYLTDAYSIENFLISESVFEEMLIRDFGMINSEQPDRVGLVKLFTQRLAEFNNAALFANSFIRWMRHENVECTLPNTVTQFISINLHKVEAKPDVYITNLSSVFRAKASPLKDVLKEYSEVLSSQDLTRVGRGKFLLDFLKRFLDLLYADRRSDAPLFFSRSDTAHGDPCQDLMRRLAGYAKCPDCLEKFLQKSLLPIRGEGSNYMVAA